jgi:hypothetical protein
MGAGSGCIKSPREQHERVVKESELERASRQLCFLRPSGLLRPNRQYAFGCRWAP